MNCFSFFFYVERTNKNPYLSWFHPPDFALELLSLLFCSSTCMGANVVSKRGKGCFYIKLTDLFSDQIQTNNHKSESLEQEEVEVYPLCRQQASHRGSQEDESQSNLCSVQTVSFSLPSFLSRS